MQDLTPTLRCAAQFTDAGLSEYDLKDRYKLERTAAAVMAEVSRELGQAAIAAVRSGLGWPELASGWLELAGGAQPRSNGRCRPCSSEGSGDARGRPVDSGAACDPGIRRLSGPMPGSQAFSPLPTALALAPRPVRDPYIFPGDSEGE